MSDGAILRFGAFELRTASAELRLNGDPVKLPPQPLKVLELLARRGGEVLTRNEIREHVWCGDTFVDFEQGLNFCIRQIREALGDDAAAPRFIETLPRRGYRFLMPVTAASAARTVKVTRLIVLPFRMLRPDLETDFLAFSLPDALTLSLSGLTSLVVRSSMVAARFAGSAEAADPKTIGAEADVDVIVSGALLRVGDQIRVTGQLTDASTGTLLWSDTAQAAVGDLFQVQDELARRILSSLKLPLTSQDERVMERDVPANAKAYDYYLRGNQLSYDSKRWATARDLYRSSIDEDPHYAPAWARLGRIHHVMSKYLPTGGAEGLALAEEAFRKALELNPDLTLTHKLYAHLEVERGQARDAMARLIERAHTADPELLAGLVTTCRYCGLLNASVAAHERAIGLEPKLKTSLIHTWAFLGAHDRIATFRPAEFPYLVPLSMAELGRGPEALTALREIEPKIPTRVRDMVTAARCLLEGKAAESIAAINRFVSEFRDPEALYYCARHLAHLNEIDVAIELFERVVAGGCVSYPTFAGDPWLQLLRKKPAFGKALRQAEAEHQKAVAVFRERGGEKLVGVSGR
ncbi:MAG TPA: winged helix-turn-helix domain-containing protein [Casimicrobiaceae bacterium]|nr:winged helix-turn-helix domain-containing protein [Casimicrobiaceae bacterium]